MIHVNIGAWIEKHGCNSSIRGRKKQLFANFYDQVNPIFMKKDA